MQAISHPFRVGERFVQAVAAYQYGTAPALSAEAARDPLFGTLAAVVAVISLPAGMKLLIDLFVPGITTLENARLVLAAVAIVVLTAVVGFTVGAHNDVFLTCDDCKVAGSDLPPKLRTGLSSPADRPTTKAFRRGDQKDVAGSSCDLNRARLSDSGQDPVDRA